MAPLLFKRSRTKGSSIIEYSLLVALLGGTAASMVFTFGQAFIGGFERNTSSLDNALVDARTAGVGQISLAAFSPPAGASGASYTLDLSNLLDSAGLFGPTELPTWSALDLPPGLTINAATGVVSGTPTAAGTYSATIVVDQGDASTQATYTFTVS